MGFEPTRAEPIGLAVQRLNHSATSSHFCYKFLIPFLDFALQSFQLTYLPCHRLPKIRPIYSQVKGHGIQFAAGFGEGHIGLPKLFKLI